MNLRKRRTDDRHCEELYARRIEFISEPPPEDETTSQGRIVFHTVWLYYRDKKVLFEEPGPRLEYSYADVLPREWLVPLPDGAEVSIGTMLLMGTMMAAFDKLANERLEARALALVPLPPPLNAAAGANLPDLPAKAGE